jgi:hypothetical protein
VFNPYVLEYAPTEGAVRLKLMNTTDERRGAFLRIVCEAAHKGKDRGKYDRLEAWLRSALSVRGSAARMGSLQKDFRKSVGQALAALPEVIVLMSPDDFETMTEGQTYLHKLAEVLEYASNLRAVVACQGNGDDWRVQYLVGRVGSDTLALLQSIFPEAQVRTVAQVSSAA